MTPDNKALAPSSPPAKVRQSLLDPIAAQEQNAMQWVERAMECLATASDSMEVANIVFGAETLKKALDICKASFEAQREAHRCALRASHRLGVCLRADYPNDTESPTALAKHIGIPFGFVRNALRLSAYPEPEFEAALSEHRGTPHANAIINDILVKRNPQIAVEKRIRTAEDTLGPDVHYIQRSLLSLLGDIEHSAGKMVVFRKLLGQRLDAQQLNACLAEFEGARDAARELLGMASLGKRIDLLCTSIERCVEQLGKIDAEEQSEPFRLSLGDLRYVCQRFAQEIDGALARWTSATNSAKNGRIGTARKR